MKLYLDASYDGRKMPRRSLGSTAQLTIRDENGDFVGNFEFRWNRHGYSFETRTSQPRLKEGRITPAEFAQIVARKD